MRCSQMAMCLSALFVPFTIDFGEFRAAGADEAKQAKSKVKVGDAQNTIVLGPIILAELYERVCDEPLLELSSKSLKAEFAEHGISHEEMVKALSRCRIYVLDHAKKDNAEAKPKFISRLGWPKLVVEGELICNIGDTRKNQAMLAVGGVSLTRPILTICEDISDNNGVERQSGVSIHLSAAYCLPNGRCDLKHYSFCSMELTWTPTHIITSQRPVRK